MIEWHLETRKIADLKPLGKNPRKLSKHDYEHLKKSLDKFGLIDKPIVNSDGTIIGGHQRVAVLKRDKVKDVECYVAKEPLSDRDLMELNIRLNRNAGEWDYDVLANEWEELDLLDWGFKAEELSLDPLEPDEEEGAIPAVPKEAKTKLGDIYEMGEHRLICGDSTNQETVEKVLNKTIPILMVTDPPYGVDFEPEHRVKREIKGAKTSINYMKEDKKFDWGDAFAHFKGHIAYVWHASSHQFEIEKSLKNLGFENKAQIIWVKQVFALTRGFYHFQHEPCFYLCRKGEKQNWEGPKNETTVWEIKSLHPFGGNKEEKKTGHAAQKPIECMARPIRNSSKEFDSVYDPFLGSGTTLIACEQLKRKCYGIEIAPEYCDVIVKRWVNYRKQENLTTMVKRNGKICKDFE